MSKLFVVRHGEIDFNTQGRYAGSVDVELNANGFRQADSIAEGIVNYGIEIIVTSPLKRCTAMAKIIADRVQAPFVILKEFRERGVGVFEGLTREEAKERYPDLWAKNITRIYDDAPTGGETIREVEMRVFNGMEKIKKMYPNKNVLIVTHGFAGKMVHKFFNRMTEEEFFEYKLDNAHIITYSLDE